MNEKNNFFVVYLIIITNLLVIFCFHWKKITNERGSKKKKKQHYFLLLLKRVFISKNIYVSFFLHLIDSTGPQVCKSIFDVDLCRADMWMEASRVRVASPSSPRRAPRSLLRRGGPPVRPAARPSPTWLNYGTHNLWTFVILFKVLCRYYSLKQGIWVYQAFRRKSLPLPSLSVNCTFQRRTEDRYRRSAVSADGRDEEGAPVAQIIANLRTERTKQQMPIWARSDGRRTRLFQSRAKTRSYKLSRKVLVKEIQHPKRCVISIFVIYELSDNSVIFFISFPMYHPADNDKESPVSRPWWREENATVYFIDSTFFLRQLLYLNNCIHNTSNYRVSH